MTFPTIHRNGTCAEDLIEQQMIARDAIRLAIKALNAASPNGRDYYPQGPDAIYQAVNEHCVRVDALQKVYRELEQIAESIVSQQEDI